MTETLETAWQSICQDTRTVNQSKACSSEEFPDEHGERMKHLDDLQKELLQIKKKLNETSVRCHKLNIDVATMFNPDTLETLEQYKEECDVCLARMSETLNEPLDVVVPPDEKPAGVQECSD